MYYFRDMNADQRWFEPIALIQHQGNMTRDGKGEDHFICDVKENRSQTWYRTNDNRDAIPIYSDDVTKTPSIVLYKNMRN